MGGLRAWVLNALQSLWFVPGAIVFAYAGIAVALVEVDKRTRVVGGPLFEGDGSAARTVLSVIAGSLITVAGLTFSITVVVLQLTSSQFSPRILRTFFGDRLTQATVGSFVGIFVYSLLVLRSVGSATGEPFVPRVSVTLATALAIGAVVLLIVFIHHISQLIQVSHVTGDIAKKTLARLDVLYPSTFDRELEAADVDALIGEWERERAGQVLPETPGYVRRFDLDHLAAGLEGIAVRVAVMVRPGDFVSVEQSLVEVWPADAVAASSKAVRRACRVQPERDLGQDLGFGLRQLTDTAVKALSPGINDPTTACTCVGYIRSILVLLATRDLSGRVIDDRRALTIAVRRRGFVEYLAYLTEIARFCVDDPRATGAVVDALESIGATARGAGHHDRASAAIERAVAVASAAGVPG